MELYNYFNHDSLKKPYRSGEEHIMDSLSWLRMLLDTLRERKNKPCQEGLDKIREEVKAGLSYIKEREAATAGQELFLPLCFLRYYLNMNGLEYLMFLLALAPEIDREAAGLYAGLQDDEGSNYPTLWLGAALCSLWEPVELSALYALCDERTALNRFCFRRVPYKGEYQLSRPVRLKKKLVMYIIGAPYMEASLALSCRKLDSQEAKEFLLIEEGGSSYFYGEARYRRVLALCRDALYGGGGSKVLYLPGEEGAGRKFTLKRIAFELGIGLLAADMGKLYGEEGDVLDDIILEAGLSGGMILFENVNPESPEDVCCLEEILRYTAGELPLVLLSGREDALPAALNGLNYSRIPFPVPVLGERLALWREYLKGCPAGPDLNPGVLAGAYAITAGAIRDIIRTAETRRISEGREHLDNQDLEAAVSENRPLSFQHLAEKVPVIFRREDAELGKRQKEVLDMALARFRNRELAGAWGFREKHGVRGLSLLFYGPPGTGKTMTAQILAGEAGLELYRIDFSRIASKYIGETEKNLDRIFREAVKRNVVLFFDEADSLFAKRTEVKNSNDRYANAQTSYLLQKIEDYDGIVILATNLYHNFDDAFIRRITYTIRFEKPDREMRKRLWKKLIPPLAPVAPDIDFAFLAEHFELSGSAVKSVLYNAACLAAGEGTRLEARQIVRALEQELLKNGKILSEEDFGKYSIYLMQEG